MVQQVFRHQRHARTGKVLWRGAHHVPRLRERAHGQIALRRPADQHRKIEVLRFKVGDAGNRAEYEFDVWIARPEAANAWDDATRAERAAKTHTERAAQPAPASAQTLLHLVQLGCDRSRHLVVAGSVSRQRETLLRAVEKDDPKRALERADELGYRWRADFKSARRRGEAAALDGAVEVVDRTQLVHDAQPLGKMAGCHVKQNLMRHSQLLRFATARWRRKVRPSEPLGATR